LTSDYVYLLHTPNLPLASPLAPPAPPFSQLQPLLPLRQEIGQHFQPPPLNISRKKRSRSRSPPPYVIHHNNSLQTYNIQHTNRESGHSLSQAAIVIEGKKLQGKSLTAQEKLLDAYYNQVKPKILASPTPPGPPGNRPLIDPTIQQEERLNQIHVSLQQIENQILTLQQEAAALQQEEASIRDAIMRVRGGIQTSGFSDGSPRLLTGYSTSNYSSLGGFVTTEVGGGPRGSPGLPRPLLSTPSVPSVSGGPPLLSSRPNGPPLPSYSSQGFSDSRGFKSLSPPRSRRGRTRGGGRGRPNKSR